MHARTPFLSRIWAAWHLSWTLPVAVACSYQYALQDDPSYSYSFESGKARVCAEPLSLKIVPCSRRVVSWQNLDGKRAFAD